MPFIPHTEQDIKAMLAQIGADSIDSLFDEIPQELRCDELEKIPERMPEMAISRLMQQRAAQDAGATCFIGAGAYQHHIPAAVWEITTRGEYYTAYTPYQAEASQGTLQLLYEYQTMMAGLTAMDTSNASLYDGASALAESILMAVRGNRKAKSRRILVPKTVHPNYRKVAHNIVKNQNIELVEVDYQVERGSTLLPALAAAKGDDNIAAVVIPQPTFFGTLEDVNAITDWAHEHKALVIAVVNPMALAILTPPGEWGEKGADIVCGEGQPLGIPLSSGGPYFGFMCATQALVRQMPGRIIGRTVDLDGKDGYVLTLQAREQHIRRSKATSNICTNQGLMVTAATIYMSLMGAEGLERTALNSHHNLKQLVGKLQAATGISQVFDGEPCFHETVLRLPKDHSAKSVLRALAAHNVLGGYDLSKDYPELGNTILVCSTELHTEADMDKYAEHLYRVLGLSHECPIQPKI